MMSSKRVRGFVFFIGIGLFLPLRGFCIGHIIVYALDTSTTGSPPPSTTAILDGGVSNQTIGASGWVMFSNVEAGSHSVEVVIAASGYLPRESDTVANAMTDPDSEYGNPRHIEVIDDQTTQQTFRFDPVASVSAVVRDAWTMERLEEASIELIINFGSSSNTVCYKYPWTATYATHWVSDGKGVLPSNTFLYATESCDLKITLTNYQTFTSHNVVTNASPGDEFDLEDVFLLPVDNNTNRIADVWETLHFGVGSHVMADADADGDSANNRDEYISGTDPTNATSFLQAAPPASCTNGLELTWNTAPWRTYRIRGTTNPCSTGAWVQVAGAWEATNGQTEMSWVETNLALSWNNSYCVDVVPCTWNETNQILIKTNNWPGGGSSGGGTNIPPFP